MKSTKKKEIKGTAAEARSPDSLEGRAQLVRQAYDDQVRAGFVGPEPPWVHEVFDDYVIVEHDGEGSLDQARVSVPIAVVDIGGRTTDTVVVRDQGILHQ